jgi:S-adenosylmethionine decarboxylase
MRKIAADIFRQRLLIEGFYRITLNESTIKKYFIEICDRLNLRMYGEPIIFSPSAEGKDENQGYDAFAPLIDSGISVYVWTNKRFVSVVLYSCKKFVSKTAVELTKNFFQANKLVSQEF